MNISTDTIRKMIERVKDKALAPIPEESSIFEQVPDRIMNHGVMHMFYLMLTEVTEYEIAHKEG